jgi:hypothetical protein
MATEPIDLNLYVVPPSRKAILRGADIACSHVVARYPDAGWKKAYGDTTPDEPRIAFCRECADRARRADLNVISPDDQVQAAHRKK